MSNDFINFAWGARSLKNPLFGVSEPISAIDRHRRLAPQKIENGHEMGPHGSKWHKNTIILHISSRSISWRPSRSEKSIPKIRMCNFGVQKKNCGNGDCKDRTCKKNKKNAREFWFGVDADLIFLGVMTQTPYSVSLRVRICIGIRKIHILYPACPFWA